MEKSSEPFPICGDTHWQKYCPSVIAAKEQHLRECDHEYQESIHEIAPTIEKGGIVLHLAKDDRSRAEAASNNVHMSKITKSPSKISILLLNQASVSVCGNRTTFYVFREHKCLYVYDIDLESDVVLVNSVYSISFHGCYISTSSISSITIHLFFYSDSKWFWEMLKKLSSNTSCVVWELCVLRVYIVCIVWLIATISDY